jgi:Flp pilus assembly protein TadG
MANSLPKLLRHSQGAVAVEFAFVAPVLFMMVFAALDIGHALYTRSVLEGETQKAARNSALETAGTAAEQAAIDAKIDQTVKRIAGDSANITFSRKAYGSYSATKNRAEEYIDADASGTCDNGESYEDSNGDGEWSTDGGRAGIGTARDVQEYTVTISYQRKFPTYRMLGWDPTETLVVKTLLRNQPYGAQAAPAILTCS